jgi:hypothetical protein
VSERYIVQKRDGDEWVWAGVWPGFDHFMELHGEQWLSDTPMRLLLAGSTVISINVAEFCRRKGVAPSDMEARLTAGERQIAKHIEQWERTGEFPKTP